MIRYLIESPYTGISMIVILLLFQLLYYFIKLRRKDGSLVIDTTDPGKDLYQIKLDTPLDDLPNKKIIVLKVEVVSNVNDISQ